MNNSLCVVICTSYVAAYSSFLMVSYFFVVVGWFFFSQFVVKQKMAGDFCKFYVFLSFSLGFFLNRREEFRGTAKFWDNTRLVFFQNFFCVYFLSVFLFIFSITSQNFFIYAKKWNNRLVIVF